MTAPKELARSAAWDRPQLTIRLTANRREKLLLIASRENISGPPGEAIDRAIELALSSPDIKMEERFAGLEERMDQAEGERRLDAAASTSALTQVASELAKLRALLAALAEAE